MGSNETRIYISNHSDIRSDIIRHFHGLGHLGTDKVSSSCARDAYWPKRHDDIAAYIASCHDCQSNKVPNQVPAGLQQPLEIPANFWDTVTTDFLSELPISENGFDVVLVIVDKLSKLAIFEAVKKTFGAREVAQVFQDRLFAKRGVPITIIS